MRKRKLQPLQQSLSSAIGKFLKHSQAKNLSRRTVEFYQSNLKIFYEFIGNIPLSSISEEDIDNFILDQEEFSPATRKARIRALSAFLNYCGLNVNLPKIKQPEKLIKPFTAKQVKDLLMQPDRKTFSGFRDYVIMSLLYDTGARISEILNIRKKDILGNGQIYVMGKGAKERCLPLGETCYRVLKEYLEHVSDLYETDYIFVSVYDNHLDRQQFNKRLKQYAKQAGINGVRVSPHTFRHTFAKMYLENGGRQFELQKILGHTTLAMVKKYVAIFDSDTKESHKKYSPLDNLGRIRKR